MVIERYVSKIVWEHNAKKANTRVQLMLASVKAKHTILGSGGCYALANVTTQIARKMLMPTDRHQARLNELEAVAILSFACRTIMTKDLALVS